MLINGIDINNYGATLLDKDIQTAEVTTYQDWLRNAPSFIVTGQKEKYKAITCELMVKGNDDDDILEEISNLIKQAEKCTIQFDDTVFIYDAILKGKSHKQFGHSHKIYTLNIEWQSGYAYKAEITETVNNVTSKTITVLGNLPTPAVVTITSTIDTVSATLTGLSKNPITIKNLHAGNPITIDGEKCTITEQDLDATLTIAQGLGKWNFRKYSMVNFTNPDSYSIDITPVKATIPVDAPFTQELIPDREEMLVNIGYDYLGVLKTGLYTASPKTVNITFHHDDGCTIYLNNVIKYSTSGHKSPNNGLTASASLNLIAGWNVIEIFVVQHFGPDGVWDILPVIGSQVTTLNCYYSRSADLTGVVNKFADADLWAFPILNTGSNTIGYSLNSANISIAYKPKYL